MVNNDEQQTVAIRVEQIIRRHTESETVLAPETDLLNDLAIDSLELVELGLMLGKTFETTLPMAEVRRCITLEELTQLVEQAVEAKQVKPA